MDRVPILLSTLNAKPKSTRWEHWGRQHPILKLPSKCHGATERANGLLLHHELDKLVVCGVC